MDFGLQIVSVLQGQHYVYLFRSLSSSSLSQVRVSDAAAYETCVLNVEIETVEATESVERLDTFINDEHRSFLILIPD